MTRESELSEIDKNYSAPRKWIMKIKIFRRIFAGISCLLTGGELGCESDIWFTVTGRGRDIVRSVKWTDSCPIILTTWLG